MKPVVLIVDDEAAARHGMRRALEKEGYTLCESDRAEAAEKTALDQGPSVVLLDLNLGLQSGMDLLPRLLALPAAPAVIVITAHGNERVAVETIKRGAFDYLAKPFEIDELRILVRNAVEVFQLRNENRVLRGRLAGSRTFGQLVGDSPAIKKVYSLIEKVAETDASVLITGESGTGKEIVAREIHDRSGKPGPFVAVNCAAIPDHLIESELFGHEKGAFTGAATKRIGKFEAAADGTLFLDEIGDMALSTQAKILRLLEDKSFQRLGSNETIHSSVRVISATNKNLEEVEIAAGRFRSDLYYRLCVVSINLPALRERKGDIPALAREFCDRFAAAYRKGTVVISPHAYDVLLEYPWPGNIRQLRNCIERAVVLSENEKIGPDEFPGEIKAGGDKRPGTVLASSIEAGEELSRPQEIDLADERVPDMTLKDAKHEFERRFIEKCLEHTSGNITQAAALLGIHRQSLQQKIKELGLTKRFVVAE
ncbi:MAG TPA: sigma-54 dependent transcriptional regulator [Blastocatellia bacterium]